MATARRHPDPSSKAVFLELEPDEAFIVLATLTAVSTDGLVNRRDAAEKTLPTMLGVIGALANVIAPVGSEAWNEIETIRQDQARHTRLRMKQDSRGV